MSGCIERVNAVVGATDGMDAMADSFGKVSACLERLITTAGTNTTGPGAQLLSRLAQSMQSASEKVRMGAGAGEAQAAVSQVEMEKLQKRLAQIEQDLVQKDEDLLNNETQLLALTE